MTAICLKAKSSVRTEGWSSIFTNFHTDAKSCIFIKQLTSTCISTILHLRRILSEDYFEEKNLNGTIVKLLKPRKGENYASKIEKWLEGAFEAIEKKYLKRLMLDIQDAETNLTLEIYTITFNYNNGEDSSTESMFKPSNTEFNTIKLLQMCDAITQTYSRLPSRVKLSMRLSYYENTPDDYQPRGYTAWEPVSPEFPKQARCIEVGFTGTQHHFFKLINKSCLNEKFFEDLEKFKSSNSTLPLENNEGNITKQRQTKAKRELCFGKTNFFTERGLNSDISPLSKPKNKGEAFLVSEKLESSAGNEPRAKTALIGSRTKDGVNTMVTKVTKVNDSAETVKDVPVTQNEKVRCACMSSDKSQTMFSCLGCKFLVHAECFGILHFDITRKIRFYCHLCHQMENFKCHDKVLVSLKNSSDQQKLAVLRKILRHCIEVDKITFKKMEKIAGKACPKNVLIVVLNKMTEIGVAVHQKNRKNYLINKTELDKKLLQYFYKVQGSSQKQHQVFPYSLRNLEVLKSKNNLHNFPYNKENQQPTATSQEYLNSNSQISQQSLDIIGS